MNQEINPVEFLRKNVNDFISEGLEVVRKHSGDSDNQVMIRAGAESAIRHMVFVLAEVDKFIASRKTFDSHADFVNAINERLSAIEKSVAIDTARVEGKLMAHNALATFSSMYDAISSNGIPATNNDGEPIVFDIGNFDASTK